MIRAYVGGLGSGKSYSLVAEGVRRFRDGFPQIYTDMVALRFPEQVWIDPCKPERLAQVSQGLLLLDEAQVLISSRGWQDMPPQVRSALAQARKNGLDLFYTTQDINRVDAILRENTHEVIICRKVRNWIVHFSAVPGSPKKRFIKAIRLCPRLYGLYDTLEIVGQRVGQGVGRSSALDRVRARVSQKRAHGPGHSWPVEVYQIRGNSRVLTPSARSAWNWLVDRGFCRAGEDGNLLAIRMELERRAWLDVFGLGPDDVGCSWSDPWAVGCSPDESHVVEPVVVPSVRKQKEKPVNDNSKTHVLYR